MVKNEEYFRKSIFSCWREKDMEGNQVKRVGKRFRSPSPNRRKLQKKKSNDNYFPVQFRKSLKSRWENVRGSNASTKLINLLDAYSEVSYLKYLY